MLSILSKDMYIVSALMLKKNMKLGKYCDLKKFPEFVYNANSIIRYLKKGSGIFRVILVCKNLDKYILVYGKTPRHDSTLNMVPFSLLLIIFNLFH